MEGAITLPGWPVSLAFLVLCVLLRDTGYVLRLKWLANGALTWRQAIETTVLWEFASAITPGIVGAVPWPSGAFTDRDCRRGEARRWSSPLPSWTSCFT